MKCVLENVTSQKLNNNLCEVVVKSRREEDTDNGSRDPNLHLPRLSLGIPMANGSSIAVTRTAKVGSGPSAAEALCFCFVFNFILSTVLFSIVNSVNEYVTF